MPSNSTYVQRSCLHRNFHSMELPTQLRNPLRASLRLLHSASKNISSTVSGKRMEEKKSHKTMRKKFPYPTYSKPSLHVLDDRRRDGGLCCMGNTRVVPNWQFHFRILFSQNRIRCVFTFFLYFKTHNCEGLPLQVTFFTTAENNNHQPHIRLHRAGLCCSVDGGMFEHLLSLLLVTTVLQPCQASFPKKRASSNNVRSSRFVAPPIVSLVLPANYVYENSFH